LWPGEAVGTAWMNCSTLPGERLPWGGYLHVGNPFKSLYGSWIYGQVTVGLRPVAENNAHSAFDSLHYILSIAPAKELLAILSLDFYFLSIIIRSDRASHLFLATSISVLFNC